MPRPYWLCVNRGPDRYRLAINDLVELPDDAGHAAVDAAVVVAVGKRGQDIGAADMWSPGFFFVDAAPGNKDAFEADALAIGIDHGLQDAHGAGMVDEELGRTGDGGAVGLG